MLTYGDVARRMNCSIMTVRRWVKAGKIAPVVRVNSQVVRIPEASLSAFVVRFSMHDNQR
jgi:excisionase family DNA binding protein